MKTHNIALRQLIEFVLREDDRDSVKTIPAAASADEQEFSKSGLATPPEVIKAKQVLGILHKKGLTADAHKREIIMQNLTKFIKDMDPQDAFVASPQTIAQDFAEKMLA